MGSCFTKNALQEESVHSHNNNSVNSAPQNAIDDIFYDIDGNESEEKKVEQQYSKPLLQPRVCFTSLFQLFMNWSEIPPPILNDCLIILNCRRQFFMEQCKSNDDIATPPNVTLTERCLQRIAISDDKQFQKFIFDKDKSGMCLWLETDNSRQRSVIAEPIDNKWRQISQWIASHNDPISGVNYSPIATSRQWWTDRVESEILFRLYPQSEYHYSQLLKQFHYCDDIESIASELMSFRGHSRAQNEILSQSNLTLIPMARFDNSLFEQRSNLICDAFRVADDNADDDPIIVDDNKCNRSNAVLSSTIGDPPIDDTFHSLSVVGRSIRTDTISRISAIELGYLSNRISFGLKDKSGTVHLL